MNGGGLPENARLAQFIVPDAGNPGMSFFSAKRRGSTPRNTQSRASAVCEPTRGAVAKLIGLQYDLPELLARHALSWVGRPQPGVSASRLFDTEGLDTWMVAMNEALLTECVHLTTGQRCADLFTLRRFRLTGTAAAPVLRTDAAVRALINMGPSTDPVRTHPQWMEELGNSWFCTRRGTEAIVRGSLNQEAVTSALLGLPCVMHFLLRWASWLAERKALMQQVLMT